MKKKTKTNYDFAETLLNGVAEYVPAKKMNPSKIYSGHSDVGVEVLIQPQRHLAPPSHQ